MVYGANGAYNVYIDKDNKTSTGCTVLQPDFSTQFDGIDGYISIETSGSSVAITNSLFYKCIGTSFDAGSPIVDSALGLNTSMSGDDVFEMQIATPDLDIRSSTVVRLYFSTDSTTSSDIVVSTNSGRAILFGVAFPIPLLSVTSLLLLSLLIFFIAKRTLKNNKIILSVVLFIPTLVWAVFAFVIDGQVNDWTSFTAIDDPIGDNSAPGNFSDITHVYANLEQDFFTARMDVVDVENQAPTANDVTDNVFEDNPLVVTMSGADADGDALTFIVDTPPVNGSLSVVTPINATSGSVVYTPNNDYNGSDSFTYFANDGQVNSIAATVDITVNSVNDAPSFTTGGTVTIIEESGAYSSPWATNILAGPADENAQTTSFTIVSVTNSTLFSSQPIVDSTGNLSFIPAVDEFGTATVTLNISDNGGTANGGVDTSVDQTFDIVITNVNDVPSFTAGANESVVEDAGVQTTVGWATMLSAGPTNESSQVLSFNVTNDNSSLFSVQPVINASGDLMYTSALNENGVATVTVNIMDDGGTANGGVDTSANQTFTITIRPVNDVPSFTKGADQTVLEESPVQTVAGWATAILAGPTNESTQTTSFNISNDNNALFSTQPSVNTAGDLSYTPLANASGVATVTISISDDGGTLDGGVDTSADQTFMITITDINDVPSFTVGANQSVLEDAGVQSVMAWATALSAGPPSESSQTLSFNVTNNNNSLFSTQPAVDSFGNLSYTPALNANGTATVTLNIMDDGGTANGGIDTSANQTFSITVMPVNDAPSFIKGADETVLEDAGAQTINGWATAISSGPADEAAQLLSFNVSNNNNALFSSQPAIDNAGNLSFTPAVDVNGTATIMISIMDNGGTANGGNDTSATQMFTINVTAVNDEPQFTKGANQSVTQNSGAQSVNGWVISSSKGPANESSQTLSYNVTNNNNALFSTQPSVNATGDLSYTSATNQNGVATITINVMDDGGTANGGDDTSPDQTFTITITNPPPAKADSSYGVTTNIQINVPSGSGLLNGATGGTGALTVGNAMNPAPTTTVNGGNLSITTATGVFTYNPPAGQDSGTDTFTYKVCDSVGICSANVTTTFNVSGNTIWFIDKAAAAGGNGRLTEPFNSIAGFNAIQGAGGTAGAAASDYIFMKTGSYNGSILLLNNQRLIGTGASGSFDAVTGITASANSSTRPALGGTKPTISSPANAINTAASNTIRGLEIANTTNYAIQGMTSSGTLTISNVDVSGTGGLVNLNGSSTGVLNVSFGRLDSSASTSSPVLRVQGFASGSFTVDTAGTTIVSTTQATNFSNNSGVNFAFNGTAGLSINSGANNAFVANNGGTFTSAGNGVITTTTGVPINMFGGARLGAASFILTSVSASGASNGIILNNTGSGSFIITGNGGTCTLAAPTCSGGSIQNTSNEAVLLTSVNGFNANYLRINNSGNVDNESAIELLNQTGSFTFNNSIIENAADDAIEISYTSAVTLASLIITNSQFEGIGDFPGGIFNGAAGNNFAGAALDINITSGATVTAMDLSNLLINNFDGRAISIDVGTSIQGGNLTGTIASVTVNGIGTLGISVVGDGTGVANVILKDSSISNVDNSAALVGESNGDANVTLAVARVTTQIVNETFFFVSCGYFLNDGNIVTDNPQFSVTLDSTTCTDAADGYVLQAVSRGSQGNMNFRATNNTITSNIASFSYGSFIGAGNGTAGESDTICSNISGNDSDGDSGEAGIATFMYAGTTHQMQGLTGSGSNQANVESFINTNNALSSPLANSDGDFTGVINYTTTASCNTPAVPAL
jgi:hypothetical protein